MALAQLSHYDDDLETHPGAPATLRLVALVPERTDEHLYGVWHAARPRKGESCRWQRTEREWVVVTVEMEHVLVRDWRGHEQRVDSYEAALRLGRIWCR